MLSDEPDEPGLLNATLEMVPLAARMQTERGPLWENDIMRAATSYKPNRTRTTMCYSNYDTHPPLDHNVREK